MFQKDKLLSIGEVSKFTGVSTKAIRYYERINILKPVYVDAVSNYRYYSIEQAHFVGVIQLCLELDIPLNDLTRYINEDGALDYSALLAHGKTVAKNKFNKIQRGLNFIDDAEMKIELLEKHRDEIYSRNIPEKFFFVSPYMRSFRYAYSSDTIKSITGLQFNEDDRDQLLEYGLLSQYSPSGISRYVFVELSRNSGDKNVAVIPAGEYICKQNETSQIENSPDIFRNHLAGSRSFITIEIDIFASKYKINKPMTELRVITNKSIEIKTGNVIATSGESSFINKTSQ